MYIFQCPDGRDTTWQTDHTSFYRHKWLLAAKIHNEKTSQTDCVICPVCLGFNIFITNTVPKWKFSHWSGLLSSFGGGQIKTSFNKLPNTVTSVNELLLHLKKPILIKPWLFLTLNIAYCFVPGNNHHNSDF